MANCECHNQMASHPLIKADARFSATKKEEADSPDLDIPKAGSQKPLGAAPVFGAVWWRNVGFITRFSKLCGYHCFWKLNRHVLKCLFLKKCQGHGLKVQVSLFFLQRHHCLVMSKIVFWVHLRRWKSGWWSPQWHPASNDGILSRRLSRLWPRWSSCESHNASRSDWGSWPCVISNQNGELTTHLGKRKPSGGS